MLRATSVSRSFAEHDLDAEPHCPKNACDDNRDRRLERKTLGLLDAFAPTPKVLEISAQLAAVFFFDTEGGQNGGDRPHYHDLDICVMHPLLFGKRLQHHGADFIFV